MERTWLKLANGAHLVANTWQMEHTLDALSLGCNCRQVVPWLCASALVVTLTNPYT